MIRYEEEIVSFPLSVRKNTKVTKGGSQFTYSVLFISGNRKGRIGFGSGKHKEIAVAKQKALAASKKFFIDVPLKDKRTLYHDVEASFGATKICVRSAKTGTGIVAGPTMRMIFDVLGLKDVVGKCIGSSNPYVVVYAVFSAFSDCLSFRKTMELRRKNISSSGLSFKNPEIVKTKNIKTKENN